MLHIRWESAEQTRTGVPVIEEFHTSKDVTIDLGGNFLTIKTAIGGQLLLSVPTWRIIDITTD